MKNVLLLGDSIRMQYQPKVKELLKGRANVYGPVENGRWSGYTLNTLRFWLPQMPDADIVHWNNGIWDIGDDYQEGHSFTSLEDYERDLCRTIRVLRMLISPDVKIIAAMTTPWPLHTFEKVERYNEVFRRVAECEGLDIDDLYTPLRPEIDHLLMPDRTHLNEDGIRIAADLVVKAITPYLD